jgi:sugar phosphate permease
VSSLPRALVSFFREPPAAPPVADPTRVRSLYRRWRAQMLWASTIGYGLYYLTRKNISVALPLLARELRYSNKQLGILGSLLYVSYAIGKAGFGMIGDLVDPRRFMAVGLALSATVNLLFAAASSLPALAALWCANGLFQATGAPPCAKICVRWFSVSERGTKWAIWNISHQAGGGVVLVLAGWLAAAFGWRGAFVGPALIYLAGALFILIALRDRPEELGLPPIDVYRNDPEVRRRTEGARAGPSGEAARTEGTRAERSDRGQSAEVSAVDAAELGFARLVVRRVLLNPQLLTVAVGSMCVYVVRYGTLDWTTKYLCEVKGQDIEWASTITSLIEFIGIPGMLAAGWISDRWFDARRAPISLLYLVALAASVGALYLVPRGNQLGDALAVGAIGFFTYGPQMLLAGVAAADACGARVAAAAVGVTGLMSYVGAIISSLGTGTLIDRHGWGAAFVLWAGASLLGALILIPLWRARGRSR